MRFEYTNDTADVKLILLSFFFFSTKTILISFFFFSFCLRKRFFTRRVGVFNRTLKLPTERRYTIIVQFLNSESIAIVLYCAICRIYRYYRCLENKNRPPYATCVRVSIVRSRYVIIKKKKKITVCTRLRLRSNYNDTIL